MSELILELHLKPRAKQDRFAGKFGERIKIEITAPPIDDKANKHLIKFLAQYFKVPQSNIKILKGLHSRDKTVSIIDHENKVKFLTSTIA